MHLTGGTLQAEKATDVKLTEASQSINVEKNQAEPAESND
jgi:hypothetical protein